jgi:hypothetical protein
MPLWQGNRRVPVVTACRNADGTPDFALTEVEVTYPEYENGDHFDRVEQRLDDSGYEKPFLHFDPEDAPDFLLAAVREYLGLPAQ